MQSYLNLNTQLTSVRKTCSRFICCVIFAHPSTLSVHLEVKLLPHFFDDAAWECPTGPPPHSPGGIKCLLIRRWRFPWPSLIGVVQGVDGVNAARRVVFCCVVLFDECFAIKLFWNCAVSFLSLMQSPIRKLQTHVINKTKNSELKNWTERPRGATTRKYEKQKNMVWDTTKSSLETASCLSVLWCSWFGDKTLPQLIFCSVS